MITVEPFKPEHMIGIEKSDIDTEMLMFLDDLDARAETYAMAGPATTILRGEDVLAVGGVIQFWKGVGEAWMMVSPKGRGKGLFLYRYMKDFLDVCFEEYGFHRIQTSVVYGFDEAHKCIMRLGFVPESMMVHYGPRKENFVRYVRL